MVAELSNGDHEYTVRVRIAGIVPGGWGKQSSHAAASSAQVRLDYGIDRITLEVEDDGRGLSSADIADLVDEETGVGVSGMRARMFQLGGDLVLEPGAIGLRVRAQIPLQPGPGE
jgi:signal transduction histidine kinase